MKKALLSTKTIVDPKHKTKSSALEYQYIKFLEELGFLCFLVPNNSEKINDYFQMNKFDLFVLTGGNNINPTLYDSKNKINDVFPEREEIEYKMIDYAVEKNIPLLGICKGFQLLNVYFGGKLKNEVKNHVAKDHILLSAEKLLKNKKANSFHNLGILRKDVPNNLHTIAWTKDGIAEAVIHHNYPILGLQWHPERQKKEYDKEIITKFLNL